MAGEDAQGSRSAERKAALRERLRGESGDSARIVARLKEVLRSIAPSSVLLYAPLPDEVQIQPLFAWCADAQIQTGIVRIDGDTLEAVHSDLTGCKKGAFGIPEPQGPAVPVSGFAAIVVPSVAGDLAGNRLGRGGGHYDRLLATYRGITIMPLFENRVARIPVERHDIPIDVVVTEHETVRTKALPEKSISQ